MAVTSSDVLSDFQAKVINDSGNAFVQPIALGTKFQALQNDVVTLNADVASLQQSWPEAVVRSYQGSRTIAQLNALSPSAGDAYVAASAGTPSAGTSDALTIGDITEYDGTQWKKILDSNANSFPPSGTVVIVGNGTLVSPLTEGTDENKLATFDGTSLTPTLAAPSDGDIRSITSTSIYAGRVFQYDTVSLWVQTTAPLSSATPTALAAAGSAGTSTSASRADHVHTHGDLSATTTTFHAGLSVAYTVSDASKNKIPDAADDVQAALTALDVAMPYDNTQAPAAGEDRITNLDVETAFATTYTLPANAIALGTVWEVMLQVNVANVTGTPDLTIALKLDGTAAASLAITSVASGNTYLLKFKVTGGGAGASVPALVETSTLKTVSGTGTLVSASVLNASFNTTTTHVVTATATWSAASTDNQADLRFLTSTYRLAAAVT